MSTTELAIGAAERLRQLPGSLEDQPGFRQALAVLATGGQATFDGVVGSSCASAGSGAAYAKDCAAGRRLPSRCRHRRFLRRPGVVQWRSPAAFSGLADRAE